VKDGFVLGKRNLRASLRGAAVCWIGAVRDAFSRNTEGRNGLAGGRVRVKFRLKIFHVKSKVQNINFLNFVFRHADSSNFRVDRLRWLILWRAIRSPPCADQQKFRTLREGIVAMRLPSSEYRPIVLARYRGCAFATARGNAPVTP
jgi:hypothetical protein